MLNSANKITKIDNSSIRACLEFIELANTFAVPSIHAKNQRILCNFISDV